MTAEPVLITLDIEAPPQEVFPYFTETEKIMEWHGGEAYCEPVPGGEFTLDIPGDHVVRGSYVEIDPPRRVVFTWGMESGYGGNPGILPEGSSTVEVTLDPTETGTRLTICHSKLPDMDQATRHKSGWTHYMARLRAAAHGDPVGPDEWRS